MNFYHVFLYILEKYPYSTHNHEKHYFLTGTKEMKKSAIPILMILFVTTCSNAADWPQYLGPNRNATSSETGLLRSWPKSGPKVLWTVPLGPGYGGAAVSEGKVYVLDRIRSKQDALRCFDLETGLEQWTFAYDAPGRVSHPGSRSTPAIDDNYIYTCGPFGHAYCLDLRTHKPLWNKNIWEDFDGGSPPRWAISQNPLIYEDMVILASQTAQTGVVAYDKYTGQLKWASAALPGLAGYVSPKIVNIANEDHLVMISACSRDDPKCGAIIGMDPKTGKRIWTYSNWQCRIPIPNVTEIGDGRLFITGGYEAGAAMFKLDKGGDSYTVTELFKTENFSTHCHPPVLHEGHLYAHCTTNERRDGMVCMDLNGKVKWKTERSPLFDKGGFILSDGLIFSVDGREGILYLIEPSPTGFKPLASAKLLGKNECWGPLALVDGKLLIRDQNQMKCVLVR
jgi:outer membrane protein assembly factor BamB